MNNPLSKNFRQPNIFISLPSKGRWWKEGAINLAANGEVGVQPMTASDEIFLKTPDGLLNGTSVVKLIQSCIPEIKDAWETPALDMDALLIAIRISSNGNIMDLEHKCPKCSHNNDYDIDLSAILDQIQQIDYSKPVEVDGLKVRLKPATYKVLNESRQLEFTIMQKARSLDLTVNSESNEQYIKDLQESIQQMVDDNSKKLLALVAENIENIETSDGVIVTDKEQIVEYFVNASRLSFKAITNALNKLKEENKYNFATLTCDNCSHSWQIDLGIDYANFLD